jgi:hypothetical protein
MSLQKVVRISVLVTKKPDVSDDAFHRYWANGHAPLVQELLVRHGIIKYTQVCDLFHAASQIHEADFCSSTT